ncbi:MAG: alternative ribosome rescue aminoacyl-tRNA hydrolase ArfB [Leptospirillia bacterium]
MPTSHHPTPHIAIPDDALEFSWVRAPGPGGQNVNKVATACVLRFDVTHADLPDGLKTRLLKLAGSRATTGGEIVIHASRHRTRERNRADAIERLMGLIAQAAHRPKKRRPTKPGRAARERRMDAKKRRAGVKKMRGKVTGD